MRTRILITGVGGQGTLSISKIIGEAAAQAGIQVVVGETRGMSKRGGVVESSVVMGHERSPLIPPAGADIVISGEPLEALRCLSRMSPGTLVLTSTDPIVPVGVYLNGTPYPDVRTMLQILRDHAAVVVGFELIRLSARVGSPLAGNMILLGALARSGTLPFPAEILKKVMVSEMPAWAGRINTCAFDLGWDVYAELFETSVVKTMASSKPFGLCSSARHAEDILIN